MKLFREPSIQQKREKMLYQAECDLLQAESMKEAYDAQVQMLRNRIARLKTANTTSVSVVNHLPSQTDLSYLFGGDREKAAKIVNGDWPDLNKR